MSIRRLTLVCVYGTIKPVWIYLQTLVGNSNASGKLKLRLSCLGCTDYCIAIYSIKLHCLKYILNVLLQSHYSLKKGAHLLGLGVNNVWTVACDEMGRMIPEELEKRIQDAQEKVGYNLFNRFV